MISFLLILISPFYLFSEAVLMPPPTECALEFEAQGPVFDPGDVFSIRICYQDESLGFPQYARADWDANDNGDPTDPGEINVTGGTIQSVSVLGTGNTLDNAYCVDVSILVGSGSSLIISASATGIVTPCLATGQQAYIVLPVELSYFEGTLKNDAVQLKWQTARESNNHKFTVQRSLDGIDVDNLRDIPGAGTTVKPSDYSYLDQDIKQLVLEGQNRALYRLMFTDLDGQNSYSEWVSVPLPGKDILLPGIQSATAQNGFLDVSVYTRSTAMLRLFNMQGREYLQTRTDAGVHKMSIMLDAQLPAGIYVLLLEDSGSSDTYKLFIH